MKHDFFSSPGILKWIEEILDRRDLLFSHSPKCPKCEAKQVQCTEYLNTPAQWKCRECKHRFEYEYIK